jgi:cell division protein ZapA (FtsZ GTPase activity inhibitor)
MGKIKFKIMNVPLEVDIGSGRDLDILRAEKYVNDICYKVKEQMNFADTAKILMIASIQIADEKIKLENLRESYEKKLNKLIKQMDDINSL